MNLQDKAKVNALILFRLLGMGKQAITTQIGVAKPKGWSRVNLLDLR